jgi:hypothetical protein
MIHLEKTYKMLHLHKENTILEEKSIMNESTQYKLFPFTHSFTYVFKASMTALGTSK